MKDKLTLTLPSELFADLAFFISNETLDEDTMNEIKQKLDQLLAGQADLQQHLAATDANPAQTINRLFTLVKRDYQNRNAIDAVQLQGYYFTDGNTRLLAVPDNRELWRGKMTIPRPADLPLDQEGSSFSVEIRLPEHLNGKRGYYRYLEYKPEHDLSQWWHTSEYRDNGGISSPFSQWISGFAPNETEKTLYIIFQPYPEINSLDDLSWETITPPLSDQ